MSMVAQGFQKYFEDIYYSHTKVFATASVAAGLARLYRYLRDKDEYKVGRPILRVTSVLFNILCSFCEHILHLYST